MVLYHENENLCCYAALGETFGCCNTGLLMSNFINHMDIQQVLENDLMWKLWDSEEQN